MIFSRNMEQALDVVAAYERFLIAEAKANPNFRIGQVVAVYPDPAHDILISYGRIIAGKWDDDYGAWLYGIRYLNGSMMSHPSYNLREATPDEQRLLWKQIDGGVK